MDRRVDGGAAPTFKSCAAGPRARPSIAFAAGRRSEPSRDRYSRSGITSQLNGCAFCVGMHVKMAKIHGDHEPRLHHVASWREPLLFSPRAPRWSGPTCRPACPPTACRTTSTNASAPGFPTRRCRISRSGSPAACGRHVPRGPERHTHDRRNASTTKPAKFAALRLKDEGAPVLTPVK
ncbi:alkylhydroperoxidase AhpD family core domain protein [Burkholderia thailandensis]|uniref:Alkylhydroperoxidase AhpD family core domain protein n=1 Tax=Burkholderia thailandensis TaxID=57975 RepID=A0AAW9CPL7_BURTH|nr:alkylhydroperoxidase AhpD family core domain protein [Burkholderia thailandensis]